VQSEPLSDETVRFVKEIAGYLNRSVRTSSPLEELEPYPFIACTRKRGSVYAYRLELDAWRASRRVLVVTEPPEPVTDQQRELNSPPPYGPLRNPHAGPVNRG